MDIIKKDLSCVWWPHPHFIYLAGYVHSCIGKGRQQNKCHHSLQFSFVDMPPDHKIHCLNPVATFPTMSKHLETVERKYYLTHRTNSTLTHALYRTDTEIVQSCAGNCGTCSTRRPCAVVTAATLTWHVHGQTDERFVFVRGPVASVGKETHPVSLGTIGGPHLSPVNHIFISFPHRLGANTWINGGVNGWRETGESEDRRLNEKFQWMNR